MRRLRAFWLRLLCVFRRNGLDGAINDELASHLAMHIEDGMHSGLSEEEARRQALIRLGGLEQTKQAYRERSGLTFLENFLRDVRYALRQLRKSPGFAITAVLILTLGIGANSAVFGVLNTVLLRPLSFPAADRLVRIFSVKDGNRIGPSPLDTRDFAARNHTFEKLAVYDNWRKNVITSKTGEGPEQIIVGLASTDFFEALDIHPILGRLFLSEEGEVGHNHVALITESFWKSHYAQSPSILGQTLTINDELYSIIGILPDVIPGWMLGAQTRLQIWEPFLPVPNIWNEHSRGGRNFQTVGLLKPGVSLQRAQADLQTIASNLAETYPVDHGIGVTVQPLINSRAGNLKPLLLLLMGAVTLILFIACSNLAALLLARNTARQREFAMRAALGASRAALMRQILVETLLISVLGGSGGVALAWTTDVLLRQASLSRMPQLAELSLDWRVLLFTFVIAVGTCLLFGLAPAVLNTRISFADALKEGGRSSSAPARQSFRKALIIVQIALSLILMVGAGLLIQTISRLENQDLGFRADHLLKAHFFLPFTHYPSSEAITRFCESYVDRIRALPGVRDAAITTIYPPQEHWSLMFYIVGRPISRLEDVPSTLFGVVDAHFLGTVGIPVMKGRDFSDSDGENTSTVAIVNQAFAQRYLANEDPIGKHIGLGAPPSLSVPDAWMGDHNVQVTIIGIMRDAKDQGLALPVEPQLITLFKQMPDLNFGFKDIIVRSEIAPDSLKQTLRKQLHALDTTLPLSEMESMTEHIEDSTSDKRFTGVILTSFAALGLMLSVVGIYGVISYLVAQRRQEIGVRLALGASRSNILWLIAYQGLLLAFIGVGVGLAGTVLAGRSMSSLLYGISSLDIFTLASASIVVVMVAFLASAIPARRAMKIDPMQALHTE